MSKFRSYMEKAGEERGLMRALPRGGALTNLGGGSMQAIIDAIKTLYDGGMDNEDIAKAVLELLGVTDKKWVDILKEELAQVTEAMSGKDPAKLKKLMAFFNDSYGLISKYIAGNTPKVSEVNALMDKYPEFDKHFSDEHGREQYRRLFSLRNIDMGDYKMERNAMRDAKKRPAQAAIEAPKEVPIPAMRPTREKVKVPRSRKIAKERRMEEE